VRFSPDGRRLLSAGTEISVWDVESGRETARLVGHESTVKSADFSPDGRRIVSGGLRDGTLRLWDVDRKTEFWRIKDDHWPRIHTVAYGPDGKTVAAGDHEGAISLWDVQTQRQIFKRHNHSGPITCLRFSSDAKSLYSASTDGTISVWDKSTGLEKHRF
jgi:WD40 repeat protein